MKSANVERRKEEKKSNPSLSKLPARGHYTAEARRKRREFIENLSGKSLDKTCPNQIADEQLKGNIEAFLGVVEVPVGAAGPLLFKGTNAKGEIFAPFATSEGTLVASATRGAKAISVSGGVNTHFVSQRLVRSPLFAFKSAACAVNFTSWIKSQDDHIRKQVGLVSNHAEYRGSSSFVNGRNVYLDLIYGTGDAAGQNMTTATSWKVCQWIENQLKSTTMELDYFVIESGFNGDKKVNTRAYTNGRGSHVYASAELTDEAIKNVLKVDPDHLLDVYANFRSASVQAGMIGFNINIANVIAAIFTATGQDIASVHESALGDFTLKRTENGIEASMVLPSLLIGTVGGGTGLVAQNRYLDMLGCSGTGGVKRLSEIIAGFCLSLDLSTLSAISNGTFAAAHERLGRNKPVDFLKKSDINQSFFEGLFEKSEFSVNNIYEGCPLKGESILSEMTEEKTEKVSGLFPYEVNVSDKYGQDKDLKGILKLKATGSEVQLMLQEMFQGCGEKTGDLFRVLKEKTAFHNTHTREINAYNTLSKGLAEFLPEIYASIADKEREIYGLFIEDIRGADLIDATSANQWDDKSIRSVLSGLAKIHANSLACQNNIGIYDWAAPYLDLSEAKEMLPMWSAIADHAEEEFPEWYSSSMKLRTQKIIEDLPRWWSKMDVMPRCLVHNDFNPRNIGIRKDSRTLVAFDWELAAIHLPQRDLVEFLCYVLPTDVKMEVVNSYIDFYHNCLSESSKLKITKNSFRCGYELCLNEFIINRMSFYMAAHTFRQLDFLPKVSKTAFHLLGIEDSRK